MLQVCLVSNIFFHIVLTLIMLSKALVILHFHYASPVWSNCSQTCRSKLQILARVILSADIRTPVIDMMHDLQWLKGYSEIIAVTAPSMFIKSEIFAFL